MVAGVTLATRASTNLFLIEALDFAAKLRVPPRDGRQITNVDDPGGGVSRIKIYIRVFAHLTFPRVSVSDCMA